MGSCDNELYVYGFALPGLPSKLTVLRHRLCTIHLSGIDAIVESVAVRPQPTIDTLQTQHDIMARLSDRVSALLPARFGSLTTTSALQTLVDTHHGVIIPALAHVSGCAQMTVRVFGVPDGAATPGVSPLTGTAFLQQRRERVQHLPAEVEVIREQMHDYVRDERVEPADRTLRVTVFHLVARASIDAYLRRASALEPMLVPHRVTVTGPAPVFAFAPELL
jgi:Gas vesicle synthesis protein GvpL/GvpF